MRDYVRVDFRGHHRGVFVHTQWVVTHGPVVDAGSNMVHHPPYDRVDGYWAEVPAVRSVCCGVIRDDPGFVFGELERFGFGVFVFGKNRLQQIPRERGDSSDQHNLLVLAFRDRIGVYERHDVTDFQAALALAEEPWPGRFGVYFESDERPTKNALEQRWIDSSREKTGGAGAKELLATRFSAMK